MYNMRPLIQIFVNTAFTQKEYDSGYRLQNGLSLCPRGHRGRTGNTVVLKGLA